MSALRFVTLGMLIPAFAAVAASPPPAIAAEPQKPFTPTHVIAAETDYYKTGPQQGRPADGKFKSGTRVVLIKSAGSYSQVETEDGTTAFVASAVLTKVFDRTKVAPEVRQVASAVNAFGCDLYGRVRGQSGNLFFSPASISTALAMTYAGAAGETEQEMAKVLHFDGALADLTPARFHAAYGTLLSLLNSAGSRGGYVLRTANRLWGKKDYQFLPDFLAVTRDAYGAELARLDFENPEPARREINAWIEQQTQDKIKDLIPPGALRSDTRLVLTNAIYFNGGWQEEFSKDATQDAPFYPAKGEELKVPMMSQTDKFRYGETPDLQVLELPYAGREVAMIVLLPKEKDGLAKIEEEMTAENLAMWTRSLKQRTVEGYLPRFKMTAEYRLSQVLQAMGMTTAFSDRADFSKMSSSEGLKISQVLHKAFVDVNEKGTEAAAATAVIVAPTAARIEPEKPAVFRADHPFVFLLRDNQTGAVLFLGRLISPKE